MDLKPARAAPGNYCPDAGTNDGIIGLLSSWNLTLRSLMRLRFFVFALLAAASFSAAAGSVDVNLSNDTIEGKFYGNAGAADWTVGALYNRDTRDRALNAGLLATGDSAFGNSRVEGGLGGKIYSVTVDSGDMVGLALGGDGPGFPANVWLRVARYACF